MAAVLALGDGAVVSHRSAAALWGLLAFPAGFVDVTVAGGGGREKRPGIKVHRSLTLNDAVTTRRHGIAVTRPKRTLRDLRTTSSMSVFRAAVRRALDLSLITSGDLRSPAALTRSELERMFLNLCRRHRLPRPDVNSRVGGYEIDFLWRDRGLIVETDGFRHHTGRAAFEADRARDARLQSLGFRVLRFTHRQLTEDRSSVIAALQSLLGQSSLTPNL